MKNSERHYSKLSNKLFMALHNGSSRHYLIRKNPNKEGELIFTTGNQIGYIQEMSFFIVFKGQTSYYDAASFPFRLLIADGTGAAMAEFGMFDDDGNELLTSEHQEFEIKLYAFIKAEGSDCPLVLDFYYRCNPKLKPMGYMLIRHDKGYLQYIIPRYQELLANINSLRQPAVERDNYNV